MQYITWRHATTLAQGGIHLDTILRILQREVRDGTPDFRTFVQGSNESVGLHQQVVNRATMLVLDMQFETVDSTEARQHVLCVHLNLRIGNVCRSTVYLVHHALHIVTITFSLVPLLQFQRKVTIRRRLFEVVAVACYQRIDTQLWQVLDTLLHLF